jgi:hypothetical protein
MQSHLFVDIFWSALVTRVLYRLRFLAEQAPFEVATFSYTFPLLNQVVVRGGVGVEEEEDRLEQVALALDIIKFHCGNCKRHVSSFTIRAHSLLFFSFGTRLPACKNDGESSSRHTTAAKTH